jgi:hypothetical protein
MDTIGPLPDHMGLKYIIVLIDTFSRYIELFPSNDVSADSAASALWKHTVRFGSPHEIITDMGSQFINSTLDKFAKIANFTHLKTIPYSKEENGIVERANKEVNRHIRNILFDSEIRDNWSDFILLTEKLLNSSTKQPIGVSPNTLLYGNAINTDEGLFHVIREQKSMESPISTRDYVDQLLANQEKLIATAVRVQNKLNTTNLKKRYAKYTPKRVVRNTSTTSKAKADGSPRLTVLSVTVIPPARAEESQPEQDITPRSKKEKVFPKWNWDGLSESDRVYVKTYDPAENPKQESVVELTMDEFILTSYEVGDYVLRRHSSTKLGNGPPMKYSSWWRGPYVITAKLVRDEKTSYAIKNLISAKEYMVDVTHIKPYYYDPQRSTPPINIAAKDIDEYVVDHIVTHDFGDPKNKVWRVRWAGYDPDEDTWEPLEHLKDVEAFHQYCIQHNMHEFLPKRVRPRGKKKSKKV